MSFSIVATTTGIRLSVWSIMSIRWEEISAHLIHCDCSDSDCGETHGFRPTSSNEALCEFWDSVLSCSFQNLVNMKFSHHHTGWLSFYLLSSSSNVVTHWVLIRVVNVKRWEERSELLINWSMKEPGSRHCCDVNEG